MKLSLVFSALAFAASAYGSAEPVEKRAISGSALLSALKNLSGQITVKTNDILSITATIDSSSTSAEIDAAEAQISTDIQGITSLVQNFKGQISGSGSASVKRDLENLEARFVRFRPRRFRPFRPFRPFGFRRPRFFNRQRINNKGRNRGGDKQGGGRGGLRNGGGGGGGAVVTIGDVGGNTNTNTNTATNNNTPATADNGADVNALADTFAGIIADILDALGAVDDTTGLDGLDGVITALVGALNGVITQLGTIVQGLSTAIVNAITPLLQQISTALAAVVAALGGGI